MTALQRLSLFRRSNGVYYLRYQEHGVTRYKSTGCTTRRDAVKALAEFRSLLRSTLPSKTLSAFVAEYLASVRSRVTVATADGYSAALNSFVETAGDMPLRCVTSRHIDAHVAARMKEVSASTVNIELRSIRAALNVAARWGYLEAAPSFRLVRTERSVPLFFDKASFQTLLGLIAEEWLKELVVFSVATGLRRGEVLRLQWTDVDLTRRLLTVRHTKSKRDRIVPLNDLAATLLEAKSRRSSCAFVFHRHGFPFGESYVSHLFKHYVRKAKLDPRLHWHSLRHTHASWLVASGVSLYAVQKLLGHSSPAVTQVYSHLEAEELRDKVNVITLN